MASQTEREAKYVGAIRGADEFGDGRMDRWDALEIARIAMALADAERAELLGDLGAALSDRVGLSLGTADWACDSQRGRGYAMVNPEWLRAIVAEARAVRSALEGAPNDADYTNRPDYDQEWRP